MTSEKIEALVEELRTTHTINSSDYRKLEDDQTLLCAFLIAVEETGDQDLMDDFDALFA